MLPGCLCTKPLNCPPFVLSHFFPIKKLLSTKQALKVLDIFILPAIYHTFSAKHFSKGAVHKINILLRKLAAIAWECMPKESACAIYDIQNICEQIFNSYKGRAYKRSLIGIYDNKKLYLFQIIHLKGGTEGIDLWLTPSCSSLGKPA